ncbi:hypothetical protein [Marinomonas primoryensis]|jgi:hypothetical protein|uniref:hypothetical protein n=1 Tax=Marinomonas primoryensis TaxID=178399 RepID=UPI0037041F74
MPAVTANNNELNFTDITYTTVEKWGDYKEKVKWKLSENAKNRGFVLQVVTFTYEVRWVENDALLTVDELFGSQAGWTNYSELWLISANKKQPADTLNQDHFIFNSMEETYGWIKETGKAYFFESDKTPEDLGFSINADCPAGIYMPSQKGSYDPGIGAIKTATIDHLVYVTWDKTRRATLIEEKPSR